jgi:hypothetical protein
VLRHNISSHLRVVVVRLLDHSKVHSENNGDDGNDDDDNEKTPPLELPGSACRGDALVELHVSIFGVIVNLGCTIVHLLYYSFLVDDGLVELLEEER